MTSRNSSALRTPFDKIMGARANVQILRVLTREDTAMGRAEVARRAGMTPQGGRKALDRLFDVGIVRYVGTGSAPQVRLRKEHPLAPALVDLFAAEAGRYRDVIRAIKSSVDRVAPPPKAVWIQGPVAEGTDEYGDPLVLGVLAAADEVDDLCEALRDALVEIETAYDVTIEVRPHTRADLVARAPEDATTLTVWGPDPAAFVSRADTGEKPAPRSHEDHDARARRRARRLGDLLVSDPGLRDRALAWVEEELARGEANRELREWRRTLCSASIPRLRRLLTADTERAVRLRQSLPFWPVLSDEEREMVLVGSEDDP